jgi:glyoxylase-like metal-dependent hydrolase (beta-lactamase superfamily II)
MTDIHHDQHEHGSATELLPDLAYLRTIFVNVFFVGPAGAPDRGWVLVDTGIPHTHQIMNAAAERFGEGARPAAIILTHGHFDHTGSVGELMDRWDVPSVYAHPDEMPFLTNQVEYPPPDPLVGGGMALASPLFPRGPIDLRPRVRELPADGSVPGMPGWRWIHTPGHTPGHVSLFRDADRALISGDAFVTTEQESIYAVATQKQHVHGPPQYFTPDWHAARESVQHLASLRPSLAATGHGIPMAGIEMLTQLDDLARNFDELAVPMHGKHAHHDHRVEP